MGSVKKQVRLERLQEHLKVENADLAPALDIYGDLDAIAHRLALLERHESYAHHISWWPLVSILGTFSAGKSSFINSYLKLKLQKTGNQAVDDRFTVIVYGRDGQMRTLPGEAVDSDPRFPFFRISEAIDDVAPGEGRRVDRYIQMKAAPSDKLKGKIFIDSPGFDADAQRTATLRITEHIIRLSDLVLVFFDARHPEAGAMQDTLKYLVRDMVDTVDIEKFVFVLNQIDTSAGENNLEDIVAAWRGALAQSGLNAGRFYISYNRDVAQPIADPAVRAAYEQRRDRDHRQIEEHLDSVNLVRTYRIVGRIKVLANAIEEKTAPLLAATYSRWRKMVLAADTVLIAGLAVAGVVWSDTVAEHWLLLVPVALIALVVAHFLLRRLLARQLAKRLGSDETGNLRAAFVKSTSPWRPMLLGLRGWSGSTRRRLAMVRDRAEALVEQLNNRNTDPSGSIAAAAVAATAEKARPSAAAAQAAPTTSEAPRAAAPQRAEAPMQAAAAPNKPAPSTTALHRPPQPATPQPGQVGPPVVKPAAAAPSPPANPAQPADKTPPAKS